MDKKVALTLEFGQFISNIKTDQDYSSSEAIDDELLTILLISFITRFFYICDDRQFYPLKSYLIDLFSRGFSNKEELYSQGVSQAILDIVYQTLETNESDVARNLFGNGAYFPFTQAPCVLFGEKAYEDDSKPICVYRFVLKIKRRKVFYKLKMPFLNPTKLFTPLALGFVIEYVYLNMKTPILFERSKVIMLDMLGYMSSRKFSEYNLVNGVLAKNEFFASS